MSDIIINTTTNPIQISMAGSVGVPSGGTVGQVLTKVDSVDYSFQWSDPPGGAASVLSVAGKTGNVTLTGSDIGQDSTHRFVTDAEKATWNAASAPIRTITFSIDSTEIINTGEKRASVVCPVSGTINRWRLVSDVSTSAVVSVWKANGARPTIANIITGSAKPTLSSALVATSTILTGWTTSVVSGDIFVISIDSNSSAKNLSIVLEMS